MIEIIAPSGLRSGGGTWSGTSWMELDVDRIDFQVNNDVKVYALIDEETALAQMKASTHQIIITGHINNDSDLVGVDTFTKTKNLILAMRKWYVGLSAGASGFPEVKWEGTTWKLLIQKLSIIDTYTGGDIINYQITFVLEHS